MKLVLRKTMYAFATAAALNFALMGTAAAHCDALDGPVITEAQAALSAGDVTPLLKWVPQADEGRIKTVFDKAVSVRKHGGDAQELADAQLFATLVEVHRASEGAPFTGIKAAGAIDPAVKAADAALESGEIEALLDKFAHKFKESARERFATVSAARAQADDSVDQGRAFVDAYVHYVHYLEDVHNAISADGAVHAH
ncbi:MAG TPA: DUF6448 family protein [Azoarcus taiwanensis]|nr:DUF6448 family protein [Azoarcus taiwanensis]HRQ57733.1 DUF6448 family protein [Azoarcus taiwanensis]